MIFSKFSNAEIQVAGAGASVGAGAIEGAAAPSATGLVSFLPLPKKNSYIEYKCPGIYIASFVTKKPPIEAKAV